MNLGSVGDQPSYEQSHVLLRTSITQLLVKGGHPDWHLSWTGTLLSKQGKPTEQRNKTYKKKKLYVKTALRSDQKTVGCMKQCNHITSQLHKLDCATELYTNEESSVWHKPLEVQG